MNIISCIHKSVEILFHILGLVEVWTIEVWSCRPWRLNLSFLVEYFVNTYGCSLQRRYSGSSFPHFNANWQAGVTEITIREMMNPFSSCILPPVVFLLYAIFCCHAFGLAETTVALSVI